MTRSIEHLVRTPVGRGGGTRSSALAGGRIVVMRLRATVDLLRLAGLVSVASGLIGGCVWLVDLADRDDGDDLRWGFWHNPFMQFPPFNEPLLDVSMWVLFACSAAAGLGGLMLLVPRQWGVPLVTLQARVSVVTNGVIAFFIVATMFVFPKELLAGTPEALVLRLGSMAVDLALWALLGGKAVSEFHGWPSRGGVRGFDVTIAEGPGLS
jgi:hypothetical protein